MIKLILFFVSAVVVLFTLLYFSVTLQPQVKVINCGIAEISPDFTTEMREACRKRHLKGNENEKQR